MITILVFIVPITIARATHGWMTSSPNVFKSKKKIYMNQLLIISTLKYNLTHSNYYKLYRTYTRTHKIKFHNYKL